MKKLFSLIAVFALVCAGLLAGCSKSDTSATPDVTSTNAPAMPSTNAPSTNAP
jgi:type IV pilus biogenesis protein CpaD/CtpE